MAPTEGKVAEPKWWWDCRCSIPLNWARLDDRYTSEAFAYCGDCRPHTQQWFNTQWNTVITHCSSVLTDCLL